MEYLCTKRSEVGDTLLRFADDVRILNRLRSDLAPEIMGKHTEFQAQVKRLQIELTQFNQNHTMEGDIGHLKKCFQQTMVSKNAPKRLWDYGLVHQDDILSRIASGKTRWTGIE